MQVHEVSFNSQTQTTAILIMILKTKQNKQKGCKIY